MCAAHVQVFAYTQIAGIDWSYAPCADNTDCDDGQFCGSYTIFQTGVCTTIRELHTPVHVPPATLHMGNA